MMQENKAPQRTSGAQNTQSDPSADDQHIANLTSSDLEQRLGAQYNLIMQGSAAVPSLLEALKNDDPHLRSNAAHVLAVIADPTSAAGLAAALDDDEDPVRWMAAEGLVALGQVGLKEALHALVSAKTLTPQLKAAVRHILLRVCDDDGMGKITKPVLAAIHEFELNEAVLVEAHNALSRLEDMATH